MAIPKILDHERKLKNIQDGHPAFSIKEGEGANAGGRASHAEGYDTSADGTYSHAEGEYTIASGIGSHAEGYDAVASGDYSHAEGYGTEATSAHSHAEGYNTDALHDHSHAEGEETTASNIASHAEGKYAIASGEGAHAEGYSTLASGDYGSHAEGCETIASGAEAHAEGYDTIASADESHAEGYNTIASGYASHTEGSVTTASGIVSHAEGFYTTAASFSQHVQGQLNIPDEEDKYAHIVGNGAEVGSESNAHTLDWDGNAWFAGEVYVGSTSGVNRDDGSKKLATEEYVDNNGGIFWATSETTFDELWNAWNMGKLLCISPVENGLGLSDTYVCDGIINYHSGNNDRIFSFSPASPTSSMQLVGGGYTLWCSQTNGWDSGASVFTPSGATVYSPLKRNSTAQAAPLSTSDAYYRPIYTSTQEPTASDGKVGDIWIVYTE